MSTTHRHRTLLALLAVGIAPAAMAIEPIPSTPGWRGFVVGGAGYVDLTSNMVAGNNLIDIGQPVIDSVAQRPRSDDTFHPVVTGEINYTFGNGWQAFFGTSLEDAVTLDGVTQLGARKDLGSAGILQGGFLFSGIPTAGLGGSVRRGSAARGDRPRLDRPAPAVGPRPRHAPSNSRSPTATFRSTPSAAARASRVSRAMRPARPCCGVMATSTTSTRPTCSGWARAASPRAAHAPLHHRRPRRRRHQRRRLPSAAELHLPWPGLHGGQQRRLSVAAA